MNRAGFISHDARARVLAVLLLLAQLFSLFIAPMHRTAHASAHALVGNVRHVAHVTHVDRASHATAPTFDWYGHAAGNGCDAWNAAFSPDIHPTAALPNVPTIAIALAVESRRAIVFTDSRPSSLFLARAPPRN